MLSTRIGLDERNFASSNCFGIFCFLLSNLETLLIDLFHFKV